MTEPYWQTQAYRTERKRQRQWLHRCVGTCVTLRYATKIYYWLTMIRR